MHGCGCAVAERLTRYGLGDRLRAAVLHVIHFQDSDSQLLKQHVEDFRGDLWFYLKHDPLAYIGRHYRNLSNNIPPEFPSLEVVLNYLNPVTSYTVANAEIPTTPTRYHINIQGLATLCEEKFSFGTRRGLLADFHANLRIGLALSPLIVAIQIGVQVLPSSDAHNLNAPPLPITSITGCRSDGLSTEYHVRVSSRRLLEEIDFGLQGHRRDRKGARQKAAEQYPSSFLAWVPGALLSHSRAALVANFHASNHTDNPFALTDTSDLD